VGCRPIDTRAFGVSGSNFLFLPKFCCAQKTLFQTYITNKILASLEMYFASRGLVMKEEPSQLISRKLAVNLELSIVVSGKVTQTS